MPLLCPRPHQHTAEEHLTLPKASALVSCHHPKPDEARPLFTHPVPSLLLALSTTLLLNNLQSTWPLSITSPLPYHHPWDALYFLALQPSLFLPAFPNPSTLGSKALTLRPANAHISSFLRKFLPLFSILQVTCPLSTIVPLKLYRRW